MLIAGPTASGKTAAALAIAQAIGGTVINADSMQVYGGLPILTARPTADEEARVPHRLFGHVDAGEVYSVGRWINDLRQIIEVDCRDVQAMSQRRAPPVIVGGTGLYFTALTEGLAPVPEVPGDIRAAWRARAEEAAAGDLHAALVRRDPVMAARLRPTDSQRLVRALEVFDATGRSLASFQQEGGKPLIEPRRTLRLLLEVDPEELRRRIDARFDAMLDAGAMAEARALGARGLDPALPAMKVHGVPWLLAHLRGEVSLAEAVARSKGDTRRYAKRQRTWARHRMADWTRVAPGAAAGAALAGLAQETRGQAGA